MTVQDLIDELLKFDPDYSVCIESCYDLIITEDDDNNEINIELGE